MTEVEKEQETKVALAPLAPMLRKCKGRCCNRCVWYQHKRPHPENPDVLEDVEVLVPLKDINV